MGFYQDLKFVGKQAPNWVAGLPFLAERMKVGEAPGSSQFSRGFKINYWWCNNHLEKYEFVNGKDYPIYYGT